jgi:DNA-binding GntR family transcriptional regulator
LVATSRHTRKTRSVERGSTKPKGAGALAALAAEHAVAGTAAEKAYAILRNAVVGGTLPPGTRLRADSLAQELGVSKTPVREALRKLEAEGLIAVQPRNGLIVKVLSEEQLIEMYYIREALEGMAARLAAENIGQMELVSLRNLLADVEKTYADGDLKTMRTQIGELLLVVFRASRSQRLYQLLKDLQDQVRQFAKSTLPFEDRAAAALTYRRNLVDVVARRDGDEAERIARANRRQTLEFRLRLQRGQTLR